MTEKKKTQPSVYILGIRETARRLVDALTSEFGYASVLCVDARGKNYRVDRSGVSVSDEPLYCSRGIVVRILSRGRVFEHSVSELTDEAIPKIIMQLHSLADGADDGEITLRDEPCTLDEATEYEIDPEEVGDEWIIEKLSEARGEALASDGRVFDAVCRCAWRKYTKLFLSGSRDMCQSVTWTSATALALTREGERIKDSYQGFSVLGGVEVIERMRSVGIHSAVRHAVELLDSEPMKAGEYDCVCSPDVTGLIVHEAFGHGVEMDMFVKDRAQAKEYIGRQVASELVSMHDSACAVDDAASYFFDDEGNLSTDTLIIDKGILVTGISDELSANRLGTAPTGNGRRENYRHKAYTRMTNTYFEGGCDSVEDMIASIDYGFYLEEARNGMEDPKNWGIQCVAGIAREIKDGKLTGKVYSPAVLTGYVPDLLRSISMMSRDTQLCGTGFCGKGHKEWVKVSDGGPAIKARIKLS